MAMGRSVGIGNHRKLCIGTRQLGALRILLRQLTDTISIEQGTTTHGRFNSRQKLYDP